MSKKSILTIPIAILTLAGCGSSSTSSHTSSLAASSAPAATSSTAAAAPSSAAFLTPFTKVSTVASTVPPSGDVNPYGIVLVTKTIGKLQAGGVLVSNYNDKANNQGTGTTIVQITPGGQRSLFSKISAKGLPGSCPGGVGLTTALSVLPTGFIVVGSLPTTNGKSGTAQSDA